MACVVATNSLFNNFNDLDIEERKRQTQQHTVNTNQGEHFFQRKIVTMTIFEFFVDLFFR